MLALHDPSERLNGLEWLWMPQPYPLSAQLEVLYEKEDFLGGVCKFHFIMIFWKVDLGFIKLFMVLCWAHGQPPNQWTIFPT